MSERFVAPSKEVGDFYDSFLIECPRCWSKATIDKKNGLTGWDKEEVLSCSKCGYLKDGKQLYRTLRLNLWYKIDCCGHQLWALNDDHLNYIEKFVKAELREREKSEYGYNNRSLPSRLPKWIQSSKNRESILKAIAKLRDK